MQPGGFVHQLVVTAGNGAARTVTLVPGVNRVGRSAASDICLDDSTVSGQHCEIVVLNEDVFVRDLSSTNGTFIEGQQIQDAALLPGQTLHVGGVAVVLEPPVHISIPRLSFQQESNPLLSDGLAACVNHAASHATMECTQCQKVFCELCVHQIRRVGGTALMLCPSCSGHCRTILHRAPEKKKKSKIGNWLSKMTAKITGRPVRTKVS